jgi:uncharacterized protein YcbK (DUF882 family)
MSSNEKTAQVISRRAFLGALTIGVALASPAFAAAPAILRNAGDFRALSLANSHTAERLSCVYWIDGEYVPEALEAFNYILRDWRGSLIVPIDPKTIDTMAATHGLLDCSEPFEVVSGYRCAKTNAMLRSSSRGVAKNSYHVKGMAVDIACKSRSVGQVASAAKSLGAGGVGRYTRSSFTHVDSGPLRQWGR